MVRYSIAASLLAILPAVMAHENGEHSDAWSYLTATLPSPLSDMSVAVLSSGEGDDAKKTIVLTGGCDAPDGNVYKDVYGGIFECASLSNKVRRFRLWEACFGRIVVRVGGAGSFAWVKL